MHVRDAVEDDAAALAARAGLPADAVHQLIHDRTVCVAEADDDAVADESSVAADGQSAAEDGQSAAEDGQPLADDGQPAADRRPAGQQPAEGHICGFLAFDADEGAVHVTQVAGDREAVGLLLEEPLRFARNEEMPVEVLVPDAQTPVVEAVEAAGFEVVDRGPWFEGEPTRRYRLEL